jgi:hypothetical protein
MAVIFAGGMIACSAKHSHVSTQHPANPTNSHLATDNDLLRPRQNGEETQTTLTQDGQTDVAGATAAQNDSTATAGAGQENKNGSFPGVLGSSSQVISKSLVPDRCAENSLRCDVAQMMEIQREAHIIFNQAWLAIWKENSMTSVSEVGSVFKSTFLDLKQMYRADGTSVTPTLDCPTTKPVLENLGRGHSTRYTVTLTDCHSNRSWERVTFEKKAALQWQMTYVTRNFPVSAQGKELQLLGKPVVCLAQLDEGMRVSRLSCQGLGQNRQDDEFAELTRLAFSKTDQSYLLQVKGIKYRGVQNKTGDFDVLVPVAGPILYTEKVTVKKSEPKESVNAAPQAPQPPQAPPATPVAPGNTTPAAGGTQATAAAGRPSARQQAKDQTQELLEMLTPEDRQQYDLLRPEEQQQALEELRWEKAQLEEQKRQEQPSQQQGEQNETNSMSVR